MGKLALVKAMLERGADPFAENARSRTPRHVAGGNLEVRQTLLLAEEEATRRRGVSHPAAASSSAAAPVVPRARGRLVLMPRSRSDAATLSERRADDEESPGVPSFDSSPRSPLGDPEAWDAYQ